MHQWKDKDTETWIQRGKETKQTHSCHVALQCIQPHTHSAHCWPHRLLHYCHTGTAYTPKTCLTHYTDVVLLFVCIHIANQNTHLKFENVNTLVKITICMFINVLLHVHFIYFILLCFKYLFLILCTTFLNIFFLLLISLFLTITVIASFT